jgi:7-cyano-7-deazaguanine reductase
MQHAGVLAAQLAKQFFVVSTRVIEFGRGRYNADPRLLAAADIDESVEDFGIVEFFFGATDRDDVTAIGAVGCLGRTHDWLGAQKGEYLTRDFLQNTAVENGKLPLGRPTGYPQNYAPDVLCPIARDASRGPLGLTGPLPFSGTDIWNAWELTWLGPGRLPRVATAEIRVPAESPCLVESKSLKLYLGSFAMSEFENDAAVRAAIESDVSAAVGAAVDVVLDPDVPIVEPGGICIDTPGVECSATEIDASLLATHGGEVVDECLYTHLLRSLCPVTSQPDLGSLIVCYAGPRIDRAALLRYVVSFRQHADFHEACVERIFLDILGRCRPMRLSVCARYQRRGGIDINPFRSSQNERPANTRLWRQ